MSYTVEYTDLEIENFQIYEDPAVGDLGLSMNYTLIGSNGEKKGGTIVFQLSPAQRTQMRSFLAPHIQSEGTRLDVNIPEWSRP